MIRLIEGDTRPLDQVLTRGGTPINLTGATVTFTMRSQTDPAEFVTGACTIVSATAGEVRYTWAAGDTDVPGLYYAQWRVLAGGKMETIPDDDEYETVKISKRLVAA